MKMRMSTRLHAPLGALLLASSLLAAPATAQDLTATFHAEGTADVMLTDVYRDRFDWGGRYAVRAGLEVVGPLAIQVSFTNAWFPVPGQAPGNLYAFQVGARGFFLLDENDRGLGGPFVDFNVGLGLTGDLSRFFYDIGAGWDFFPHEMIGLGPVVRFGQIVQPDNQRLKSDALMFSAGLNVTLRIDLGGSPVPLPPQIIQPEPAGDADEDGVTDDRDQCVDEPEDRDRFQDEDGCPEADNDTDGILDGDDECPNAAETRNGHEDEDGCPDEAPAVRERHDGELLPQAVRFRVGSSRVRPRFLPPIREVCALMAAEPEARLRVIGHTDEQGTEAGNHSLGSHRAGSVTEQLILCGVSPTRIDSRSYGDTHLTCGQTSDGCHEQNRRVELRIIRPRP